MARRVEPAVLAFALGFGVFLAFSGGAAVGPPDPVSQLLVAAVLFVLVTPVVYWVLEADRVGDHSVRSRRPFPYLVAVTVGSVLAAVAVPTGTSGVVPLVVRGGAFLAVFAGVSWVAALWWRGGEAAVDGE